MRKTPIEPKHKLAKTQHTNAFEFWVLRFRFLCVLCALGIVLSGFPPEASAGLIVQRPLYIGLDSGLVGYWSFDGPDMAGVTAYDRSGQNNTGTLTNGPTRAIGRIGQALNFDGVDDYVKVLDTAALRFAHTDPFSITYVFKAPAGTAERRHVTKFVPTTFQGYSIFLSDEDVPDTLRFQLINNYGAGNRIEVRTTTGGFDDNLWHRVVVTYSGSATASGVTIYVDGVSRALTVAVDALTATSNSTGNLNFGTYNDGVGQFAVGLLDDVRIYNRVLNEDEIKRLYKIGATLKINKPVYTGLDSGLVGYWSFDGPDMAGTTALDRSGQGNNGTLTNGPVRAAGKIGQALNFDGSNDRVSSGSATMPGNDFTVSAWIKSNTAVSDVIFAMGDHTDADQVLRLQTSKLAIISYWTNNANNDTATPGTTVLQANNWYHVVWTRNSSTLIHTVYLNGVSDGTATVGGATAFYGAGTKTFDIGNRVTGLTVFNGLIDDVRVYNRALSSDEIKRLYKIGATFKINVPRKDTLTDGLVGYWSFDGPDMAGVTAYDRSGQGNNGTLTNGPTRAIGRIGQAIDFAGSPSTALAKEVNAGSAASLDNITNLAISLWFKASALAGCGDDPGVIMKGKASQSGNWRVELEDNGTNAIRFLKDYSTTDLRRDSSADVFRLNQWHHLIVTSDGSATAANTRIYVDSVETGYDVTTNGVGTRNSDGTLNLTIGGFAGGSCFNDGLIDDVRIYNRALSADEIKRLYNMGR